MATYSCYTTWMNQKWRAPKFGTSKPFCTHSFCLYHNLPKTGLLFNTNLRIALEALLSSDSFCFLLWTCVYFIRVFRSPWALSCIALFICHNTKQCSGFPRSVDTAFVNFPFSAKSIMTLCFQNMFFLNYVNRELKRNLYRISDSAGTADICIELLCWHTGQNVKKKKNQKPNPAYFLLSRKKQLDLNFPSAEQLAELTVLQYLKASKY